MATMFRRLRRLNASFLTKTSPLMPHGVRRKVEQIKNHGEAVDVIRSLSAAWNHHEVMHVINPKVNTRCCVMPYAFGDYILTCGEITCQSFGLDKKESRPIGPLSFLAPPAGLEPATP